MMQLDKLQHIYDKHARDFGLEGAKNAEQLQKLQAALEAHEHDEATQRVHGRYRGQPAVLSYCDRTSIVVVRSEHGDLIAAFKASAAQSAYILFSGRLN